MSASWRPSDIPDLTGKNAVVTGSGRELGRSIVVRLAERGANVFAVSRDELPDDRFGANVEPVQMVPTSMASIQRGAERIRDQVEKIDLLVHAATIATAPRFRTAEGHGLMLATNYLGFVLLSHELAPAMRRSEDPRVVLAGPGDPLEVPVDLDSLDADADVPWPVLYHQSRIAAMIFAMELNVRATAHRSHLLSAVAEGEDGAPLRSRHHPIRSQARSVLARLGGGLDDTHATPALFASTAAGAAGGTYYAPAGRGRLHADPIAARLPAEASSDAVRDELWQRTEDMLGIRLDVA